MESESKVINMDGVPSSRVKRVEAFEIVEQPTPEEVMKLMARVAKMLNHYVSEVLRTELLSCANPATNALCNASATLETGAIQFQMLLQQQSGFQRGPAPGMPVPPFRTN